MCLTAGEVCSTNPWTGDLTPQPESRSDDVVRIRQGREGPNVVQWEEQRKCSRVFASHHHFSKLVTLTFQSLPQGDKSEIFALIHSMWF